MPNLQWFRLYHRIIDDEKIRLIAFEDRWHFIAVCCLKADGLLDEPDSSLKWRKVAVKLGVQLRELDEIKRRLFEVGLVDADMQPVAWDELQFRSDTSTERVRKYREKSKAKHDETPRNVSVTPQDTETEADPSSLRSEGKREPTQFDELVKVLDTDHANAVIAHRKNFKSKFSPYAARLLAKEFAKCADPNLAAETMIRNGWQGFEAEWMQRQQARGSPPRVPNRPLTAAEILKLRREQRQIEDDYSAPGTPRLLAAR